MARLDDLNDDCLLMVLDLLPPEELMKVRLNSRLRRLANDKLRDKTRVIRFKLEWDDISDDYFCDRHLDSINKDQQLVLWLSDKVVDKLFQSPTEKAAFLNLFSICSRIKCIDFDSFKFPDRFLLEVVRRCPELECIDLNESEIKVREWSRTLEVIGPKLVHFNRLRDNHSRSDLRLFELVVENCPNIQQVDCFTPSLTGDLLSTLSRLPKCCLVKLDCGELHNDLDHFEDVIDELDIKILVPSLLGSRVERLSSLFLEILEGDDGVEFAGLKRLDYHPTVYLEDHIACLIASRFPSLEMFVFTANGLSQDDYQQLFQRMPALKVLNVCLGLEDDDESDFELPQLSSVNQLKKLETLNLGFEYPPWPVKYWQRKKFLQQVEEYVDEIKSLKILVVDLSECKNTGKWKEAVIKEVEQMNLKQDRVKVESIRSILKDSFVKVV